MMIRKLFTVIILTCWASLAVAAGWLPLIGIPNWVQSGAIFDEIIPNGLYWPRPLSQEIVDTRSTTKYVTDGGGSGLTTTAINTLPITNAGMLIEPAATNIILQSQHFGTTWFTGGGGTGSISFTDNVGGAPDGTTTAASVTINRSSAADGAFLNQTQGSTVNTYTQSLYFLAKTTADVGKQVSVWYYDGNVKGVQLVTLTASWQRFSSAGVVLVGAGSNTISSFGYLGSAFGGGSQTGAVNFYVWGTQIEVGTRASSYFTTTTVSATRSKDSAVIQRTGVGKVVFTFSDGSQQTISGIDSSTQFIIPTTLNMPLIARITGYAPIADPPPSNFVYSNDIDGAYFTDEDGAYMLDSNL